MRKGREKGKGREKKKKKRTRRWCHRVKATVAVVAAVAAAAGCAAARAIDERIVRAAVDEGPDGRPAPPLRDERERAARPQQLPVLVLAVQPLPLRPLQPPLSKPMPDASSTCRMPTGKTPDSGPLHNIETQRIPKKKPGRHKEIKQEKTN